MLIRPPEARAVCCSRHLLSGTASLLALNARRNAAKHITTCCAIAPLLGSFRKGLTSTVFASYFRRARYARPGHCELYQQTAVASQTVARESRPHRGRAGLCATGKGHRLRAKRHRLGPTHTTQPPLPLDRLVRVYRARWGWRVGEPPRRTGACAPGGARACAPALTRPRRRTARTMDGDVQYADYHWTTAVVNPIAIGRPLRMREITLPRLI